MYCVISASVFLPLRSTVVIGMLPSDKLNNQHWYISTNCHRPYFVEWTLDPLCFRREVLRLSLSVNL